MISNRFGGSRPQLSICHYLIQTKLNITCSMPPIRPSEFVALKAKRWQTTVVECFPKLLHLQKWSEMATRVLMCCCNIIKITFYQPRPSYCPCNPMQQIPRVTSKPCFWITIEPRKPDWLRSQTIHNCINMPRGKKKWYLHPSLTAKRELTLLTFHLY